MKKMGLNELRDEFLSFFEKKSHLILPSFSLVPKSDKSLLLINAGMAPLKPYFTGESTPPSNRVATCQKCIRTADIENVGKTDRHATFFEMLGNFSFGDYFKNEAIEWSWEFITERLGIPKEDLWISIYENDDEAYEIWNKKIGVDDEKIVRLGKEDNFWELEVGPCGPCSEIYVDRGEEYGCKKSTCKPGCECDRFVEIWNLVFSQYDKDKEGNYNPLPNPNIDTGMGLERVTAIMEDAKNIFEVEEIKKVINEVEKISGVKYGVDPKKDASIRIITDHARSATFLVSDGVLPSNEGRGYVLRRLIRRAARHGKLLGIEGEFLISISSKIIDIWKKAYPEIKENEEYIKKIIKVEEEKFERTIHQGLNILEDCIEDMKRKKNKYLDGKKAFKLYDTYGFPLDLTKEILEEKGFEVDEEAFDREMTQQRRRARKARQDQEGDSGWKATNFLGELKNYSTEYKGYESLELSTKVIALVKDNKIVSELKNGDEGIIFLEETSFYPESGGQVGDTGVIKNNNFKSIVKDTKLIKEETIVHFVKIEEGSVAIDDEVFAIVNKRTRKNTARNHSATHLLHKTLKKVLGEHVNQAGSLVLPDRLRFDFTHYEAVNNEDLNNIERIVNEKIFEGLDVQVIETDFKKAKNMGAVALFEDKYKEKVRVVKMGDYSIELCGGTHVKNTGDIGLFKIISESSVASGVRRIEAVTGEDSYKYLKDIEEQIEHISNALKVNKSNIAERAINLTEELKEKDREIEKLNNKITASLAKSIVDSKRQIQDIEVITYKVNDMDMNSLRNLGDELKQLLGSGVIVLASLYEGKVYFVSIVTEDVVKRGIHAGNIVRDVAKVTGGGGGGRPNMAQAGGKDISKVDEALDLVNSLIKERINKY